MEPLLLNDEHARNLGECGRQAVHRDFNVDQMATKLLDVYESARSAGRMMVSSS